MVKNTINVYNPNPNNKAKNVKDANKLHLVETGLVVGTGKKENISKLYASLLYQGSYLFVNSSALKIEPTVSLVTALLETYDGLSFT